MHHCLLVDELVLHIIGFLGDDGTGRSGPYLSNRRHIARLARTCRCLMDPSLDVLWRTQHTLSPLVMCLPEDLWEKRSPNTIFFKRTPLPEDWARLRRYSRRIQRISPPKTFALPRLEENILKAMLAPTIFGSLFPSLRTLDFTLISIASPVIGLLASLLSPRVTDLSFALPRDANMDTVRGLFEVVPRMAGSLETLRISSFVFSPLEMNFAEQDLPYLRDLSLSHNILLSSQSLLRLATSRYLRELNLRLSSDFENALVCSAPPAFSALQQVKISAHTLSQCTTFLSCITSVSLEAVSFSYDTQAESMVLTAFLRQVQLTCTRAPTFHTLVLRHNIQLSSTSDPPFTFHPSALAPLLSCRGLRVLKLIHLGSLDLDDAFIAEAARAWSELEELKLCSLTWTETQRTTLGSIRELTRHCSKLTRLHMAFDASNMNVAEGDDAARDGYDVEGVRLPESWSRSPLRMLNVRDSRIEDARAVARFLRMVAPALQLVNVEGCAHTWRMWRAVQALLID